MQKFSDLQYKRPDLALLKQQYNTLINQFTKATSFVETNKIILEIEKISNDFSTSHVISNIRNTMDTTDKFYDKEMEFYNEAIPSLMPIQKKYFKALLKSRFIKEIENEYGSIYISHAKAQIITQSSKIIRDKIKENKLCHEYQKLTASCSVDFRGEKCNFYGLQKHMESIDRTERKEAFIAWSNLHSNISEELDETYYKLVKARCKMAKKLGFSNYTKLAYLNMERFDYQSYDVKNFRKQVLDEIVPLCTKLYENQAKKLGVDKLKYYDELLSYPDGNPIPHGTKDEMINFALDMYHEMSPETGDFFDYMVSHELFDLETRPGKHMGGYCTELPLYKAPFIFSNFNGTSADVDVLTHEAGHAFQYYISSRFQKLSDLATPTVEVCEIHSMTMEHFAYPWMKKFFGQDADKYISSHLSNAFKFIPYIVAVDEFQHCVFDKPNMKAKEYRSLWSEIEHKYMPWRDYDGVEFMDNGGFWMQKQHIFLYPFYYIDYALAQMGAFELYGKMKNNKIAAWSDYMELCKAGGSHGYFNLLKIGNLSNPFEDGSVKKAISGVIDELDI